jgi:hypothetical protein
LHGDVIEIGHEFGVEVFDINSSQWRKHFLGVSRAPAKENGKELSQNQRRTWIKRRCIEECAKRGWDVGKSNDAADALGVLDTARALLDPAHGSNHSPLFEAA